jgi:capsid protein
MKIRERIDGFLGRTKPTDVKVVQSAAHRNYLNIYSTGGYDQSFDGERNLGAMGPIVHYTMDFDALRSRSWQSYAESEITQTVIKRYCRWVIGSGLRLQCTPAEEVLRLNGIDLSSEGFNDTVERYWEVYSKSPKASLSGMKNLDQIADEVKKNAMLGGDVLVRIKYKRGSFPSIQIVDGQHVRNSMTDEYTQNAEKRGNRMLHGVEVDKDGKHIGFVVRTAMNKHEYVQARTNNGMEVAFLVYGNQYRTDDVRGVPLMSVVLETLSVMERYKNATLTAAEERAKIAYFVEHQQFSDGSNPIVQSMTKALSGGLSDNDNGNLPVSVEGTQLADTFSATTNSMMFNMPIGSKINTIDTKIDLLFKEFYTVNIDIVCAAVGIPPEVAMSKYDSNFSASRAALKDWEHTLKTDRADFTNQFYKKVYEFWLFTQIFENSIIQNDYVKARIEGNDMVVGAFTQCRFVGDSVPHIDPLKEVEAERMKLGDLGKNVPLTTVESATEALNSGDSDSNIRQFGQELNLAKEVGIDLLVGQRGGNQTNEL